MLLGWDFLIDERTGDPVFDEDGTMQTLEDRTEIFRQHVDSALHQPIGEDPFLPGMGLNIEYVIRAPYPGPELRLKKAITDALNFDYFPELQAIEGINVTGYQGEPGYVLQSTVRVKSVAGTSDIVNGEITL